jgi:hypothetical protein
VDRVDVPRSVPVRSAMGGVALLVLMAAEFGLGGLAFGRSLDEQLSAYASAPGAIGFAAQIVFAAFPIVQVWRR